ncbi:protease modulator HflC [Curvivirga aplysinae]|uniref:protease modulator HflC n=1 Tax=Curvivirga aplysinae TaxID=2529852 RepID=UPI0012BC9963|nr:protease modulator HflC [Curvivirga aplysinae]MTI09999.1 protease modulator HflC [Curvivirga aplysinae]
MKKSPIVLIILVIAILIGIMSTAFTVRETEKALVMQFGNPVRVIDEAGLNFKIPFVQNVRFFDNRVLDYDANVQEIPTSDQKQVLVDAYARYRITDPLQFFQAVNNEFALRARLDSVISRSLRDVLGEVPLEVVMTPKRADLMRGFTDRVEIEARKFGIQVVDVRIRRIDLPEENSQAIYRRMQTQREQEARKFRAEGDKESRRIRAEADKEQRVILAEARKNAEILRGEGDAKAQGIYNDAYGRDADFFDFWRSMQAMQKGLGSESTTYVGPPTGDFFRFFGDETGKGTQ